MNCDRCARTQLRHVQATSLHSDKITTTCVEIRCTDTLTTLGAVPSAKTTVTYVATNSIFGSVDLNTGTYSPGKIKVIENTGSATLTLSGSGLPVGGLLVPVANRVTLRYNGTAWEHLAGPANAVTGDLFVSGNATVTNKLTVGGVIDPTGIVISGQTAVPQAATAGEMTLWSNASLNPPLPLVNLAGVGSLPFGASGLLTQYVVRAGSVYPTIQSAIDAALAATPAGSTAPRTVFVPDETYTELLTINGPLNLLGMSRGVTIHGGITIGGDGTGHAQGIYANFVLDSSVNVPPSAASFDLLPSISSATADFLLQNVRIINGAEFNAGVQIAPTGANSLTIERCDIMATPGVSSVGGSAIANPVRVTECQIGDGVAQSSATNYAFHVERCTLTPNPGTLTTAFNNFAATTDNRITNSTLVNDIGSDIVRVQTAPAELTISSCTILQNTIAGSWAIANAGTTIRYGGIALENAPGATDGIAGAGTKTQMTLI